MKRMEVREGGKEEGKGGKKGEGGIACGGERRGG